MPTPRKPDPKKYAACGNCGCKTLHSAHRRGDGYADECMHEESYWNADPSTPPTRCGCTNYDPVGDVGYVFRVVKGGQKIVFAEIGKRGPKQLRVAVSEASDFRPHVPADAPQTPADAVVVFVREREEEIVRIQGEIEAARETLKRWGP